MNGRPDNQTDTGKADQAAHTNLREAGHAMMTAALSIPFRPEVVVSKSGEHNGEVRFSELGLLKRAAVGFAGAVATALCGLPSPSGKRNFPLGPGRVLTRKTLAAWTGSILWSKGGGEMSAEDLALVKGISHELQFEAARLAFDTISSDLDQLYLLADAIAARVFFERDQPPEVSVSDWLAALKQRQQRDFDEAVKRGDLRMWLQPSPAPKDT